MKTAWPAMGQDGTDLNEAPDLHAEEEACEIVGESA